MHYEIYRPTPALQPFIDSYWHIDGYLQATEEITLMPEVSINLFINLGENITSTRFNMGIKHEGIFLVEPMMQTDIQLLHDTVLLFGIKFKPVTIIAALWNFIWG